MSVEGDSTVLLGTDARTTSPLTSPSQTVITTTVVSGATKSQNGTILIGVLIGTGVLVAAAIFAGRSILGRRNRAKAVAEAEAREVATGHIIAEAERTGRL